MIWKREWKREVLTYGDFRIPKGETVEPWCEDDSHVVIWGLRREFLALKDPKGIMDELLESKRLSYSPDPALRGEISFGTGGYSGALQIANALYIERLAKKVGARVDAWPTDSRDAGDYFMGAGARAYDKVGVWILAHALCAMSDYPVLDEASLGEVEDDLRVETLESDGISEEYWDALLSSGLWYEECGCQCIDYKEAGYCLDAEDTAQELREAEEEIRAIEEEIERRQHKLPF